MSSLPLMVHELNAITRRRRQDDVCVQEDPNAVFCEHCGADLKLNYYGPPKPLPARFLECACGGDAA